MWHLICFYNLLEELFCSFREQTHVFYLSPVCVTVFWLWHPHDFETFYREQYSPILFFKDISRRSQSKLWTSIVVNCLHFLSIDVSIHFDQRKVRCIKEGLVTKNLQRHRAWIRLFKSFICLFIYHDTLWSSSFRKDLRVKLRRNDMYRSHTTLIMQRRTIAMYTTPKN